MRLIPLDLDLDLVEAVVEIAISDHPSCSEYHAERERCYDTGDSEQRARSFEAFFRAWFIRLGLDAPLTRALEDYPLIRDQVAKLGVTRALGSRDEGAELFVAPAKSDARDRSHRHLCLRLRPEIFGDPDGLDALLHREFEHTCDMLDPSFGYEPELPSTSAGPTHDRLLLDRYATLWSTTVSGRLVRRGCALDGERARASQRFADTFPMLDGGTDRDFERLFDGPRRTHQELVAFAIDPRRGRKSGEGPDPGSRCALCDLPSHSFEPDRSLEVATVAALRSDFPQWRRSDPICPQCAELYRSRRTEHA